MTSDEIERLRHENAELRYAVAYVCDLHFVRWEERDVVRAINRAARDESQPFTLDGIALDAMHSVLAARAARDSKGDSK
jgi:hypothetical protein